MYVLNTEDCHSNDQPARFLIQYAITAIYSDMCPNETRHFPFSHGCLFCYTEPSSSSIQLNHHGICEKVRGLASIPTHRYSDARQSGCTNWSVAYFMQLSCCVVEVRLERGMMVFGVAENSHTAENRVVFDFPSQAQKLCSWF